MSRVDVLAIAAHPDDIELICGGTLIRAQMLGRKTGILDLAAGELATRGTPELRAKEAAKAAKVMGVSVRKNLGLPDGGILNTPDTRAKIAV
ncbi:MAG TPA: PIG-L family deacetylase, partial [Gemmatimonadaceae bacterium]|nr:PIG-L family deacetylase [Gemmatimonadaceae bacterium]